MLVLALLAAVGDWLATGARDGGKFPAVSFATSVLKLLPNLVAILPGLSASSRHKWYERFKGVFPS